MRNARKKISEIERQVYNISQAMAWLDDVPDLDIVRGILNARIDHLMEEQSDYEREVQRDEEDERINYQVMQAEIERGK